MRTLAMAIHMAAIRRVMFRFGSRIVRHRCHLMSVAEFRSYVGIGVMRRYKEAESDCHYRQEAQKVFSKRAPHREHYLALPVTGRSRLRLKIIVAMSF